LIAVSLSYCAPIKIGIGWQGKSGNASSIVAGFEPEIKLIIPDIDIEYQ
jgi:hypothetical protein